MGTGGLFDGKEASRFASTAIELAEKKNVKISVAVVDDRGEILCFMTNGALVQTRGIAIRKAYTAARTGKHSGEFAYKCRVQAQDVTWFDPKYTGLLGGVVFRAMEKEPVIGAIGVSGLEPSEDEDLALSVFAKLGITIVQPNPNMV